MAPAAVFGTSSGGAIALCLLIRRPEAVRGAVLHEPALYSLSDDPAGVRNAMMALAAEGMASGGAPAALERFWRFVGGDPNWDGIEDGLRQRMLASAETYLGVERKAFGSYLPDAETLTAIAAPVQVLASEHSRPFFGQAACRLAERLNVPMSRTAGTHLAWMDRPFLRQASDIPPSS